MIHHLEKITFNSNSMFNKNALGLKSCKFYKYMFPTIDQHTLFNPTKL